MIFSYSFPGPKSEPTISQKLRPISIHFFPAQEARHAGPEGAAAEATKKPNQRGSKDSPRKFRGQFQKR